jgi:LAO/AO transport system kinase
MSKRARPPAEPPAWQPAELAAAVAAGDRAALARAITLVESTRVEDEAPAEAVLQSLLPRTGNAIRVGITGAPGVGKSTLIEALGLRLCRRSRRVAVLAVDPSSARSGGSILGDKTRMNELAREPNAFIRPSPGGLAPGGVAARTREAMLLCEAAGYDTALIETIGTGQSEVAVAGMVDFFLVLLSPAAGDELQGIKRGVMELADAILVHKADGDLAAAADRAAQQCMLAMRILHTGGPAPRVVTGSSVTGRGLDELWASIEGAVAAARADGRLARRRREQLSGALDAAVRARLLQQFLGDPAAAARLAALAARVEAGELLPGAAARQLVPGPPAGA